MENIEPKSKTNRSLIYLGTTIIYHLSCGINGGVCVLRDRRCAHR